MMPRVDLTNHRTAMNRLSRRSLLRGGLSVGALSLLTGCNLEDDDAVDRVLFAMSRWNDTVQAALFNRARMAPTYTDADITDPFPFNAYYPLNQVRQVDGASCRLELSGLISEKRPWTLSELAALPQTSQLPDTSVSKAGAPSAHGVVWHSATFSPVSVPIRALATLRFGAPTTIAAASSKHNVVDWRKQHPERDRAKRKRQSA